MELFSIHHSLCFSVTNESKNMTKNRTLIRKKYMLSEKP